MVDKVYNTYLIVFQIQFLLVLGIQRKPLDVRGGRRTMLENAHTHTQTNLRRSSGFLSTLDLSLWPSQSLQEEGGFPLALSLNLPLFGLFGGLGQFLSRCGC